MTNQFLKKIKESAISVLPIVALVVFISLVLFKIELMILVQFVICSLFLVLGIAFFTHGADTAMLPIGDKIGSELSKRNKVIQLIICAFILGTLITVAEPDLMILAEQVKAIDKATFTWVTAIGVGSFMAIFVLKTILKIPLQYVLMASWGVIIAISFIMPDAFLPVTYDSGSVSTGAISVPFIIAFGAGIASVRSVSKKNQNESFGMIAMSSVGPIIAVAILVLILNPSTTHNAVWVSEVPKDVWAIFGIYLETLPHVLGEVVIILVPIFVFFLLFNFIYLKLPKMKLVKIFIGIIFAWIGISIFIAGVKEGFFPMGLALGDAIGGNANAFLIIPILGLLGFSMTLAEPAVHVLAKQVQDLSSGIISNKFIKILMCCGVGLALVFVGIRAYFNISLLYFIIPIYVLCLILSIFVSQLFVGMAFDAGGVTTGTMATTFILPLMIGFVAQSGGNILIDAFGTVAMIACMPILMILCVGLIYKMAEAKPKLEIKKRRRKVVIVDFD